MERGYFFAKKKGSPKLPYPWLQQKMLLPYKTIRFSDICKHLRKNINLRAKFLFIAPFIIPSIVNDNTGMNF
ncbi:MAG: hypothetical protein BGO70_07190 [Bacteroidetes bacterium 43-93]|nr:MAG: hypothetical protein BGO70_07190 [Bacteroidetes bacterium 43-93]